jgi:hypothetical protein
MSPEQWGEIPRDGSSEIDGRADIYSLGLVFYEMIVGSRPYTGVTLHELRREHVSVTPPPLHEVVQGVPRAFSDAIARATAKDRGDRQGTANQFAAELRAAVEPLKTSDVWAGTILNQPQAATVVIDTSSQTKVESGDVKTSVGPQATVPPLRAPQPAFTPAPPQVSPAAPVGPAQWSASDVSPAGASMDMASSATVLQPPKAYAPAPAEVAAPPVKRRGPMIAVGIVGALAALLLIIAVGGFIAYKWTSGGTTTSNTSNDSGTINGSGTSKGTGTNTALTEAGQYWMELPQESNGEPVRVAGVVPLASGQQLKFHFVFNSDGYLYIIGPGEQNQPTTFLTAKPVPASGLSSNQVKKGVDLSFPTGETNGEINTLQLDKKPGTDEFTIIFSPTPLTSPQFLLDPAGRQLTIPERGDLASFVEQYRSSQAKPETNDSVPTQQFVALKVPASRDADPITFVIRIEHK